MSTEQYNSETERSSQDKSGWGHSRAGHHHQPPYFHQQDLQQFRHAYAQPGFLGPSNIQSTATAKSIFGNLDATIDDSMLRNPLPLDFGEGVMPSHHVGMLALRASSNSNHKNPVDIAQILQQLRGGQEPIHPEKPGAAHSTQPKCNKNSPPNRICKSFVSPMTVRPVGTKDRHSKVRTAKGLRDRRVRLSAPTAIQFFDVQDRLGYDQPSKAVDWLIKKARTAIDELAPVEGVIVSGEISSEKPVQERKSSKHHDLNNALLRVKDEEQSLTAISEARTESRVKARERARERAKEKITATGPPPTTAPTSTSVEISRNASTSITDLPFSASGVQHLPEFCILPSQARQQFDELHRPPDMSSMLDPPSTLPSASQLIPFSSAFFSTTSATSAFIIPGDGPPLQHSIPKSYNATNNIIAPNSPRGTLQSIFSSHATSSVQANVPMTSLIMMGPGPEQAHAYGSTLRSLVKEQCGNEQHARCTQRSVELESSNSQQHSHIPLRIRGMEMGSHLEDTRIIPSSMQADYQ